LFLITLLCKYLFGKKSFDVNLLQIFKKGFFNKIALEND